jgi:hypothetical protein
LRLKGQGATALMCGIVAAIPASRAKDLLSLAVIVFDMAE